MKEVSVLIPYMTDDKHRQEGFNWLIKFYEKMMPEVEICIGEGRCKSDLFSKAKAINHAAKQATRNIYVIADSDIFYDPNLITKAIDLLKEHPWVIPYHRIHYLSKNSTKKLVETDPAWPISINVDAHTPNKKKKGGINIVTRTCFETINGFDERFCGWGGEDEAFVHAMNAVFGKYVRLDKDIYHLWHSRGKSASGNPYYQDNKLLHARYRSARKSKEATMKLVNEQNRL
ncbi:galactosyltransferase-related protein [Virgibacillus halodenitrificans]|uniref:galactosyltransferase-related protein n=1 Tax=Virgibacillus halodenitrificans TaxID=1482 RepID=UPI00045CE55E|nr:galactosyltransferase-related protein [Virgibacillus halodenitrificans]CDQ31216.1 Galactosyltransferase [Virgibacillus halodenitrificans]